MAIDDAVEELLRSAPLEVEGQLAAASNATLRCAIDLSGDAVLHCVYKPVAGERPLWDFPLGGLARREVAMFELSRALDMSCVPLTVWRKDGPFGPGMCQLWIDEGPQDQDVNVFAVGTVPSDWQGILRARDERDRDVVLAHRMTSDLRGVAILDVLANNADRKAGHVLRDEDGHLWVIDHGVTFHTDPKLRTVLWGWAGSPITEELAGLRDRRDAACRAIEPWLDADEVVAFMQRWDHLLEHQQLPLPPSDRPAIPWPVF